MCCRDRLNPPLQSGRWRRIQGYLRADPGMLRVTRVGRIQLRGGEAESDATQNAETGMPTYRTRGFARCAVWDRYPCFVNWRDGCVLMQRLSRLPAAWSALTRRSLGDQERLHPEITPHPKLVSAGPPPKT